MEKDLSLKKLRNKVAKMQDEKRFEHTLGVEFTAASLAMKYGEDIKKARIAGLLHDCAKCMTDKKRLSICAKNDIPVTDIEKDNPFLLHGKVGAYLAKTEFAIEDEDILAAITYHTTGRAGMSRLEKIIFIADYIEPGRKQAPNLSEIRAMAFDNLDAALVKILEDTLSYLRNKGGEIDPMTEETRQFYCNKK